MGPLRSCGILPKFWFHIIIISFHVLGRDWLNPEFWLDFEFIDCACAALANSFPHVSGADTSLLVRNCRIRYLELALRHVSGIHNGFVNDDPTKSTDLCVLDFDRTLLAYVPANFTEKYLLAPSQEVEISRDGTMGLINVLHETSVEVVIYSFGSAPHVILSMISIEITYNHFWRSQKLHDGPRTFRFRGLIPANEWPYRSLAILQYHQYDEGRYKRIMVVDDEYPNTRGYTLDSSLRKLYEVKILKLSDHVFGDVWTESMFNGSGVDLQEMIRSD